MEVGLTAEKRCQNGIAEIGSDSVEFGIEPCNGLTELILVLDADRDGFTNVQHRSVMAAAEIFSNFMQRRLGMAPGAPYRRLVRNGHRDPAHSIEPQIRAIWQEVAQRYENAHPGVKVKFDFLENEAFKAKLPTLLQSKKTQRLSELRRGRDERIGQFRHLPGHHQSRQRRRL